MWSQNIEVIVADQEPYTPESLIRNFFIGEGVQILDIKFEGSNKATGYFQNGIADIGIDQGIILSTGSVNNIDNPNSQESSTLTSGTDVVNSDLNNIIGINVLKDVITYEITFIPSADSIQFNYAFASEEYPEYVCSNYNDVFGFFISGQNPAGGEYSAKNIAIVPSTINLPVSINNVNNGMAGSSGNAANCETNANLDYAEFYNDVNSDHLIYDGILDPFIAAAKVVPCQTYTIKISIGDANDFLKDSAVFLKGKSFSSNTVDVKAVTVSANGTIIEGCSAATLQFEIPYPAITDQIIPFSLIGTADNGIDYSSLPSHVTIPVGQTATTISITPLEDGEVEPIETVGLIVTKGSCSSDTIWVGIEDNNLIPPMALEPIFLCTDNSAQVDFNIPFDPPSPSIFRNQNETRIDPINTPIYSTIKVENIYPSTLNQTDFIQVCIDELSHPWIEDLSIYLYGPNNQFIELTSKNGGSGGNGTGTDFYLNTCFTFDATQLINDSNISTPFSGFFQPEGNWEDFFGNASFKVNGNWRLMMIDDFQGSVGTLQSWSIHFGKSYDINYLWSPDIGISCTDCPDPVLSPTESQNYTLNIEDTNGCTLDYTIIVNTGEVVPATPVISCDDNSDSNTLSFSWEIVTGADSYQIRVNGGPWEDIGTDLNYSIEELMPGTTLSIEVQAIGDCNNSEIATISCTTTGCALLVQLIEVHNPDCDNVNSGTVEVTAANGLAPFTFELNDESNSLGYFENLPADDYLVKVIDSNGCTAELSISLKENVAITIDAEIDNIDCDEDTGSILLNIEGGTGELEYTWTDNFTGDETMLVSGTYGLTVTDEVGCTNAREFIIEQIFNFILEFEIEQPNCNDPFSGKITLITNDISSLDVIWSTGAVGATIDNLGPGSYSAIVKDQNGCEVFREFMLQSTTTFSYQTSTVDNLCAGEANGKAMVNISGGKEPYIINWSTGHTGEEISNLTSGKYFAEISDSNGCTANDSIFIAEPAPLGIEDFIITPPSCTDAFGSIQVYPAGGVSPYKYQLNDQEFSLNAKFSNLIEGNYTVVISDKNGCKVTSNQQLVIPSYEEIDLMVEDNFILKLGDSISLHAIVTNRNDSVSYHWWPSDDNMLSCTDCAEPILYGINSGMLEVMVEDKDGCSAIKFISVQIDNRPDIYIPNAFSPNGDGVNDRFTVFGKENQIARIDRLCMYDKWGNEVFISKDIVLNDVTSGWDGNYRGEAMNNGVFAWNLVLTFVDGRTESLSGNVTLIK